MIFFRLKNSTTWKNSLFAVNFGNRATAQPRNRATAQPAEEVLLSSICSSNGGHPKGPAMVSVSDGQRFTSPVRRCQLFFHPGVVAAAQKECLFTPTPHRQGKNLTFCLKTPYTLGFS